MTDDAAVSVPHDARQDYLARWPTGAKLFLILSLALLPLALIAAFATLRVTQIADTELRSHLRVAAAESSRSISIELVGDMTALRVATDALTLDSRDAPSCARAQGVFAQQAVAGAAFAIFDRAGRLVCGRDFLGARRPRTEPVSTTLSASVIDQQGLVLRLGDGGSGATAAAFSHAIFSQRSGDPMAFRRNMARRSRTRISISN